MSLRIYRVVVRGMFADVDADTSAALRAAAAEHDIFVSAYTAAGSFTYDDRLQAFSFRYEMRVRSEDDRSEPEDGAPSGADEEAVLARSLELAAAYLEERGIGFKRLRANATDMADLWR